MKKTILLFYIIFSIILMGCSFDTDGWKTSAIENYGTISIPSNWILSENNGKLYITDKSSDDQDKTIYFFQSNSFAGFEDDDVGDIEKNIICNKFQNLKCIESNVLSNGVVYGKCLVSFNGNEKEKLFFEIYSDDLCLNFISWDDNITDDILFKIANSYTAN